MMNGLDSSIYYKNLIHFSLSLFMIYIGYIIANKNLNEFYSGFLFGAIISGIFGILQFCFWVILKYDFPPLRGVNNCNSFANAGLLSNILDLGRIFGFAPEPSMYGLLMIVALIIAIHLKKIFSIFIVGLGILLSMSLSALLLIFIYIIYKLRKSIMFKIIILLFLSISIYTVKNIIQNVDLTKVSTESNLIERVSNISQNGSFISRMNSIFVAVDVVLTHPIIGIGYNERLNNLIVENAIASVEVNTGINSLLLLLTAIFGIPIVIVLLYPIFKIFIISYDGFLVFLSLAMLIPSLITLGYYSFYLPWVGLGFAASIIFKSKFTQEKAPV
jgi:hypothetical protein